MVPDFVPKKKLKHPNTKFLNKFEMVGTNFFLRNFVYCRRDLKLKKLLTSTQESLLVLITSNSN